MCHRNKDVYFGRVAVPEYHHGEFKNCLNVGVSTAGAAAENKHWEVILALPKALRASRKHMRTDVTQIRVTIVMMTLLPVTKLINYVSVLTCKPERLRRSEVQLCLCFYSAQVNWFWRCLMTRKFLTFM